MAPRGYFGAPGHVRVGHAQIAGNLDYGLDALIEGLITYRDNQRSNRGDRSMKPALKRLAAITLLLGGLAHAHAAPPLLVPGDEPIIVTQHAIRTPAGLLAYEARVGRQPIRNDETGEVKAHISPPPM